MSGEVGVLGGLLFWTLVVVAVGTVVLVGRYEVTHRRSRSGTVISLATVVLVLAGAGLTLLPVSTSTVDDCLFTPSTAALGPDGSLDSVAARDSDTDLGAAAQCIDAARWQTTWAALLVLVPALGYVPARRTADRLTAERREHQPASV